jgi:hypothetical protein
VAPLALDYHERAPFKFNGTIEKVRIRYTQQQEPANPELADD